MSVSFNNTGTIVRTVASSSSSSFSVTAGGSNQVAIAVITCVGTAGLAISTVTYGGNSMTAVGAAQVNSTGLDITQTFYLVAPPTGSNTLAVTGNANVTAIKVNLVSFNGVNQTNPIRASSYTSASGTSSSPQVVVSSNSNDITVSCVSAGAAAVAVSSTNQTIDSAANVLGVQMGHDHCTTPAASITHTWTLGSSSTWCICGFSLQTLAVTAQSFTETVSLVETLNRFITKTVTDTFTLTETFNRAITKRVTEVFNLVETLSKALTINFIDIVSLTETFKQAITVKYIEVLTLIDLFHVVGQAFTKTFNEVFSLIDNTLIRNILDKALTYFRQYLLDLRVLRTPSFVPIVPETGVADRAVQYFKQYLGRI